MIRSLAAALLVTVFGCGGSEQDIAGRLLSSAPLDTYGLHYANLSEVREDGTDPDLAHARERALDSFVAAVPIQVGNVDKFTTFELADKVYFLVSANVDQSVLVDKLSAVGFQTTVIGNADAWVNSNSALVLTDDDEYLFGPKEGMGDFLRVARREQNSLMERDDMVKVLGQLLDTSEVSAVDLYGFCDADIDNCTAHGFGVGPGSYNQNVFAFESEDAAHTWLESVPDTAEADLSVDGKFVTVITGQSDD